MYAKKKTIYILDFNYKLIKYYKLINLFNNKIKINCFSKLARMLYLQNNIKNNKFFSKYKTNIFLINNKKKLEKQIFVLLFFLCNTLTSNTKITIFICSNSIKIETIKIFKIINILINKLYNKS